jgi:hypothetical protein
MMMTKSLSSKHCLFLLALLVLPAPASKAQQILLSDQTWSADLIRPRGQPVIPLFDGWFANADGSKSLCFSFFNLNSEQSLTIPLGTENYLSDASLEAILPTHFDPLPPRYRHKFCVFTVTVPASFGIDETVVWNLASASQSLSIPGHILPAYVLDEPASGGRGDVAPLVRLSADGVGVRGRKGIFSEASISGRVGEAVNLSAWVEHPDEEIWLGWAKHSGPGAVEFGELEYMMKPGEGPTEVKATFAAAGRYIIRMQTIDSIAAFEFYCCHTNAYFMVDISN